MSHSGKIHPPECNAYNQQYVPLPKINSHNIMIDQIQFRHTYRLRKVQKSNANWYESDSNHKESWQDSASTQNWLPRR